MADTIASVTVGGKTFKVYYDLKEITDKAHSLLEEVTNEGDYYDRERPGSGEHVSQEDCIDDVKRMISDIKMLNEYSVIEGLVRNHPKKKNGTFALKRVQMYQEYMSTGHYVEDYYGWFYHGIRMVAFSDTEARIMLQEEIQKY